eukprot:896772-Rhodomonas_salina.1
MPVVVSRRMTFFLFRRGFCALAASKRRPKQTGHARQGYPDWNSYVPEGTEVLNFGCELAYSNTHTQKMVFAIDALSGTPGTKHLFKTRSR